MKSYYFTFGQGHVYTINGILCHPNMIAVIRAPSYESARNTAIIWFDNKFHNQYSEETWSEDILKYYPDGIKELN